MHKPSAIRTWTSAVLAVLAAGFCALTLLSGPATAQSQRPVIYLDQAWSQADRETYYQISQNSVVMSYDIFLSLEVAGSQDLFRTAANSDHYGLITQPANPRTNPDGLPIGLSKTVIEQGPWKGEHIGLTCAACHNAQLNYKGQRIRIDGGVGNTFDLIAYLKAFDDAVQATLADAAKFDRLAARMGAASAEAKSELRKRFEKEALTIHTYRTRTIPTPATAGPSRMDAIALIVNRLTTVEPNIPENWTTPMAPTKPPFLWNAPQGSWTQWRGVQQDPIERNLIESMGVFMPMNLHAKSPAEGLFDASAALLNLQKIENMLNRLAPPKWPEEVFGAIDRKKAAAGKTLFMTHCSGCHNAWPYTWTEPNKYGKRFIEVGLIPDSYVGTDPGQFRDLRPYAQTAHLAPDLPGPFKDKEIIPTGDMYYILSKAILETALAKLKLSEAETIELHGYREFPLPRPVQGLYKAAPRDGVWATPPFMHNGSVPNLYEMLIPAKERTKKFYVGREFDPVKVGLDTTGNSGKFLLDTTQRGNSNAGHSFENGPRGKGVIGPLLTDAQRWALVEYLKSIPEEPGRVTPFGGPPNAKSGKPRWAEPPR
ncbi:MAG TPA: di-heme-cytochrome C peroxidase [Pseudoxanthomonas sp.]